jgi:hypothetical protein
MLNMGILKPFIFAGIYSVTQRYNDINVCYTSVSLLNTAKESQACVGQPFSDDAAIQSNISQQYGDIICVEPNFARHLR